MILQGWEVWLRGQRPKRIFGELELSEERFRELLATLRKSVDCRWPPRSFRCVTLAVMTFTARYDYFGSFWNALKTNVGVDEIDTPAWGRLYNESLRSFDLTIPPDTWMIYVGPVLFHAILPAGCEDEFAELIGSLPEELDVGAATDEDLAALANDWTFRNKMLGHFVRNRESHAIAFNLLRSVYATYKLGITGTRSLQGHGHRTRLLLPYGLDFIDAAGVVKENTHIVAIDEPIKV